MYESAVLFDGSLPDDVLTKEKEKVEEFLKANAQFERTDVWGKKTLAYTIGKKKSGYYCLFIYSSEGDVNEKLNRMFKLNQKVLRHLTVLYEEIKEVTDEVLYRKPAAEETEEGAE
jgi:small subunit ribosomal protein S6